MSHVYVLTEGGKLRQENKNLVLETPSFKEIIRPGSVDQIVFLGGVDITRSALATLVHWKLPVVFLNRNGAFNARLTYGEREHVALRMKQYDLLKNSGFCLRFSQAIVEAKIENQIQVMRRIIRNRKLDEVLLGYVRDVEQVKRRVRESSTVEEVRGHEGLAAKLYFAVLARAFLPEWAVFCGRTRQPPEDNVNAVLSFLYTLLFYRLEGFLMTEGFDVRVGFFHALEYNRPSLALDCMEEFRALLVDNLVISLFNKGVLKPEDFEEKEFGRESIDFPLEKGGSLETKKGVLLTTDGCRKVITHFEETLREKMVYYEPLGEVVSWKQILLEQVRHLKRVVMGEEESYKPFVGR